MLLVAAVKKKLLVCFEALVVRHEDLLQGFLFFLPSSLSSSLDMVETFGSAAGVVVFEGWWVNCVA